MTPRTSFNRFCFGAFGFSLFLVSSTVPAAARAEAQTPETLFKRLADSVFVVEACDAEGAVQSQGSGVAVAPGQVVTNHHVVVEGSQLRLRHGTEKWSAHVSRCDVDRDLCVLSVEGLAVRAVQVRLSGTLAVGERVYAIGAPEGLELTLTEGLISGLRSYEEGRIIQTSAAISHGSSGGGLFDAEGRLIGITTSQIQDGQNLNFALPAEWIPDPSAARPEIQTDISVTDVTDTSKHRALLLYVRGSEKLMAENVAGAAQDFREAIKLRPDLGEAWFGLGAASLGLDRTEESISALRESIRLGGCLGCEVWWALSMAFEKSGRLHEALEAVQRAISAEPAKVSNWTQLGAIYEKLERHTEGIEAYTHATRIAPGDARVWLSLGGAYRAAAEYQAAAAAVERSVSLDPTSALAWTMLGNIHLLREEGDLSAAKRALETAVRLDPTLSAPWNNLVNCYDRLGDKAKAFAAAQEAVRLAPNNPSDWYNLGAQYAARGERSRAVDVYRRLQNLDPQRADEFFRRYILP